MKKATLLLVLLFITTLGFSQNKIGGDDPIPGIDIIIKKDPGSQPLPNPGNDPLIEQMNKLEFEYLNLKASQIQNEFANKDLTKLKTKEEIYKAYIAYLKKKITEEKPKMTKMKTIRYRSRGEEVNIQEKKNLTKERKQKN